VHSHSRVEMALGEATVRAKNQIKGVLKEIGKTLEEVSAFVQDNPEMQQAADKHGDKEGVIGVAANLVAHAAERMKAQSRLRVAVSRL
jgi:hypothetical protein